MKARILPTNEFAESGKTDTVVLIMTINATEAGIISDYIEGADEDWEIMPTAVQMLRGYFEAITTRSIRAEAFDSLNTDGRLSLSNAAQLRSWEKVPYAE